MMKLLKYGFGGLVVVLMLSMAACEQDLPDNPYDPYNNPPVDTTDGGDLDPTSIQGLYKNIFKPTCANSGCHDGTFEPDFRSVESSYSSLVYLEPIKQDTTDPLPYRVYPGDHTRSMLYRRLTVDLYGNSGIMPLVIDPGNDWEQTKEEHIANIVTWINNGAPDLFGVPASGSNLPPQMRGFYATANGSSTPLDRAVNGYITIPVAASSLDLYFALEDDELSPTELSLNKLEISLSRNDFTDAVEYTITSMSSPVMEVGFFGGMEMYYHKLTISDPWSSWSSGQQLFVRLSVQDNINDPTQIPGRYSSDHIKLYFSMIME